MTHRFSSQGSRLRAAPLFACALVMLGGACGNDAKPAATSTPACQAPPPGEGPDAAATLQEAQAGGTWCLGKGQVLTVYLHAPSPDEQAKWRPIGNDAPKVLRPGNNGAQTLVMGVTGGIFDAVGRGTAHLSSSRSDGSTWSATVVVR